MFDYASSHRVAHDVNRCSKTIPAYIKKKAEFYWTINQSKLKFLDFYDKLKTNSNQSTAMINVTSSAGNPTVSKTITIVTRPACGIPAAPILAAVAVTLKEHYL